MSERNVDDVITDRRMAPSVPLEAKVKVAMAWDRYWDAVGKGKDILEQGRLYQEAVKAMEELPL